MDSGKWFLKGDKCVVHRRVCADTGQHQQARYNNVAHGFPSLAFIELIARIKNNHSCQIIESIEAINVFFPKKTTFNCCGYERLNRASLHGVD